MGGGFRPTRRVRFLVDDGVPCCAHGRFCLRVEEGSARMGLSEPALVTPREKILDPRTGKPAGGSDPFFSRVNSEPRPQGLSRCRRRRLYPRKSQARWTARRCLAI